jgi:hypothetical protein
MCAIRDCICRYDGRKGDFDEFYRAYKIKTGEIRGGGV